MIVVDCEQGTEEWLVLRAGIPTASMFSKIITSTGKASTSANAYMNALLADWYVGRPVDAWEGNEWTQRGNELEPRARKLYEMIVGEETKQVGFCFKDDGRTVGCSPDSFVGEDGLLEIKCPKASTLIGYMLEERLPTTYKAQVQGQLWITGRQWCDFLAYHPDFKPVIIRVERDEKFIAALEGLVNIFIEVMILKRDHLAKMKAA